MTKTTKDLLIEYNALAKAAGKPEIKAWKESKDKLQVRINALYSDTAEAMIEATNKEATPSTTSAAQWAKQLGKNPKVVRAKLRKQGFGTQLKDIPEGSDAHKVILSIQTVEKK